MEFEDFREGEPVPCTSVGGGDHLPACMATPVFKGDDPDPVVYLAFGKCEDGCPAVAAAVERGQQLAVEHRW
jgi:hypothetical protein